MHGLNALDLEAYMSRIGLARSLAPDLDTLGALHLAHVSHVPFENVDIQIGRAIRLDLASLQAKLVAGRRGGYCFEQNTLFQHVLQAIGFEVVPCEARTRGEGGAIRPRTHMVLVVRVGSSDWLCDVGFGADTLLGPVRVDGGEQEEFDRVVRVVREGTGLVLRAGRAGSWTDLYAFEPRACHPVDFEVASWYVSTHPDSVFVRTLTAQSVAPGVRRALRQLTYTVQRGEESVERREIARRELPSLLHEVFGIAIAQDARLSGLDG